MIGKLITIRLLLVCVLAIPCMVLMVVSNDREYTSIHGGHISSGRATYRQVADYTNRRLYLDSAVVLCVSSVALFLGIPRHSPQSHSWPGPGRTAIILTVAVSALMVARHLIWWLGDATTNFLPLLYRIGNNGAIALIAGWSLVAAVGAWRRNDDPADLPGRILGWCWLVLTVPYWIAWAVLS